jgi:SAM-dependent methyltransferase
MATILDRSAVDAYDALAPFYDRFTAHHDYELWIGGLLGLARTHGLNGNRVLDAGCGTGKSFLPLLERGFDVTACDQCPAMLDIAASKVEGRVTFHCHDLRDLDPIGEFDLITCLDDVANYLTEPDDLTAALAGLAQNLRPGGLLLFDANTVASYRDFFRATVVVEDEGLVMVWRGLADDQFGAGGLARAALDIFSESRGLLVADDQQPRAAPSPARDHRALHRERRAALRGRARTGPGREPRARGRRTSPHEGDLSGDG